MKGVGTVCPAFRKGNKSVISPDYRIRRGLGPGTQTVLYKLLASWSCPELTELNLIELHVATIVARPFTLTVKGGNKPSEEEIRVLFPRIQESGGYWDLNSSCFIRSFSFLVMS